LAIVLSQYVESPGSSRASADTTKIVTANASPNIPTAGRDRADSSRYVANSGASAIGANFVAEASARKTPRAGGEVRNRRVAVSSRATRASLVFDSSA
jgi:hypothetical protein